MLKVESQPNEDRTLTLKVEVSEERIKPALESAARQLSKRYPLPGFRPGRAPLAAVRRQFGEQALYEIALDELGPKIYEEALDQEKIEAYAPGALTDLKFSPMLLTFTVPLKPEVQLGDYRAVRVDFTAPAVPDEEQSRVLDSLRERQAVLEPVERASQLGDMVSLDINGFLNEGLNPSDFLLADKDVSTQLDSSAEWPMKGFSDQVVGLKTGENKKFDLAFPEDYANESLRGQPAHWEVTVKEVKSKTLPEWNDDLAKSLGEYESLDDLRTKVRQDLENQAKRASDREYGDKVLNQVVAGAAVTYPPVLLEQEMDDILHNLDHRLRDQGLTLEDYLKIEKKTREEFREEQKPNAEERLKRALVLGKLVELEGIDLQPDDVVGRIEQLSAMWGERADEMRKALNVDATRRSLTVDMLTERAMQRLMAIARGETVPELEPAAPAAETPAAEQSDENA